MKNLIFALCIFGLMACEKTIDYDLPTEEPQLAVSSKIVAGDSIHAIVSISSEALNPVTKFSEDATLTLFENGTNVATLTVDNDRQIVDNARVYFFTAKHNFIVGADYKLQATQANYESVVGNTSLPSVPIVENVSYDPTTFKIKANIKDPSASGNIYRIELVGEFSNYALGFSSKDITVEFYEGYSDFLDTDEDGEFGYRAFVRDEFFNGGTKNLELKLQDYFGGTSKIFLKITAISNSQFEFEKSIDIFNYADIGPFSEPVTIFSNMSNSKGVFGAESSTYVQIL